MSETQGWHAPSWMLNGVKHMQLSHSYKRKWVLLLHSGCPVAVANLWDVTDRDIDRFSQAVLKDWLGNNMEKVTSKQHICAGQSVCISTSITNSRSACRLTSLIGAAPICYGIPVSVNLLTQSKAL